MESTSRRPGLHLAGSALTRSSSAPPSVSLDLVPVTTSAPATPVDATTETAVSSTAPIAESQNNTTCPAMTPEMRNIALQRLAEGVPPSTLGTVLPSPRPEYLQALFLGPMSQVDLYLTTRDQDASNPTNGVNDNDYVVYFDEWSVEEVVDRATAKQQKQRQQNTTTTTMTTTAADGPEESGREESDRLEKTISVRRIQNRVTRHLNNLRNKVHNWNVLDEVQARKYNDALEVIVNDPIAQQPGALENLVTHWRTRLGWIDSSVGYWSNATSALLVEQKFRFVAYAPAFPPVVGQTGTIINTGADFVAVTDKGKIGDVDLVKYIWSDTSGVWKTEDGIVREKENVKRERNAWLVHAINRIEREFYDDLVMDGAGYVQRYMTGGHHEITDWPSEEPMAWSGGVSRPGQKTTRRRKVKKQTPRRGLGSVSFVPEDGGLMPLQALAQAAMVEKEKRSAEQETLVPAERDPEKEIPESSERDAPLPAEKPLPEFLRRISTEGEQAPQGLTPAKEKPVEVPVSTISEAVTTKPKTTKKKAVKKSATTKPSKPTKTADAVKNAAPKKRKRSQDDEEENTAPVTTRVTRSASTQPVAQTIPSIEPVSAPPSPTKKKRKVEHTAEQEPEPAIATRKSSRIAKRKAESMEPEEEAANIDVAAAAAENPSKRRKIDAKPTTATTKKDSRERTVSAEPTRPKARPPKAQAAGTTLSTIAEVPDSDEPAPLTQKAVDDTKEPVCAAAASGTLSMQDDDDDDDDDLVSIHVTPQITPHKPSTTLTTTPITTADYPIMTSSLRQSLMTSYPFLANLPSESPAAVANDAGTDSDGNPPRPGRLDDWLSFLSFFGRDDSTSDRINGFFDGEGSVAMEMEFLGELKKVVAGLRRVVGEEGKFVWV